MKWPWVSRRAYDLLDRALEVERSRYDWLTFRTVPIIAGSQASVNYEAAGVTIPTESVRLDADFPRPRPQDVTESAVWPPVAVVNAIRERAKPGSLLESQYEEYAESQLMRGVESEAVAAAILSGLTVDLDDDGGLDVQEPAHFASSIAGLES